MKTLEVENSSLSKRKLSSDVWLHMKKLKKDGVEYGVCNHCNKHIKGGNKAGTTGLKNHLERCPAKRTQSIGDALHKQKQIAFDQTATKVQVKNFTFDAEVSRRELACAIIIHEYPLSIVEHFAFRKFVASLQPLFKMVSRNTIKNEIIKIYDIEKQKLRDLLSTNIGRVAITTDMWTSNQKKGYMSITAHFVDEDWNLQSRILR